MYSNIILSDQHPVTSCCYSHRHMGSPHSTYGLHEWASPSDKEYGQ